jgi:hypothetical protein
MASFDYLGSSIRLGPVQSDPGNLAVVIKLGGVDPSILFQLKQFLDRAFSADQVFVAAGAWPRWKLNEEDVRNLSGKERMLLSLEVAGW